MKVMNLALEQKKAGSIKYDKNIMIKDYRGKWIIVLNNAKVYFFKF